ncbi:MAG: hypothetical protein ACOYYS_13410 [Chloroflexota bacterium]
MDAREWRALTKPGQCFQRITWWRKSKYGDLVRPLPRKHKDKTLAATAPDETYSRFENGREIRAEIWRNLVLNTETPDPENETFGVALEKELDDSPFAQGNPGPRDASERFYPRFRHLMPRNGPNS